jgi:hypothetical protein
MEQRPLTLRATHELGGANLHIEISVTDTATDRDTETFAPGEVLAAWRDSTGIHVLSRGHIDDMLACAVAAMSWTLTRARMAGAPEPDLPRLARQVADQALAATR